MKRYVSVMMVASLMLGMTLTTAHSQVRQQKRQEVRTEMRQGDRQMISPEKRAEYMAKQLELSDAEKLKVQALFEKQEAKAKLHREEMKKKMEEHRAMMNTERKSFEAEMIKIIGTEKFQQLQSQRIARLEKENKMLKMRREQPGEHPKMRVEKRKQIRQHVEEKK